MNRVTDCLKIALLCIRSFFILTHYDVGQGEGFADVLAVRDALFVLVADDEPFGLVMVRRAASATVMRREPVRRRSDSLVAVIEYRNSNERGAVQLPENDGFGRVFQRVDDERHAVCGLVFWHTDLSSCSAHRTHCEQCHRVAAAGSRAQLVSRVHVLGNMRFSAWGCAQRCEWITFQVVQQT